MKTLFDIGDVISFSMRGKVVEYSASRSGDCYVIEITSDDRNKNMRVYVSTEMLTDSEAKLICQI